MVDDLREIHRHLFAFLRTYGELGNLANWQQHIMDYNFEQPAAQLKEWLGEELPAEAIPDHAPVYAARIIVPELRTSLDRGEDFTLPVIITTESEPAKAVLKYREMGKGKYLSVPLRHVFRKAYKAEIPAAQLPADFEYYIELEPGNGEALRFPVTAPEINQTVVIK
jgi:hypothetical protein